MNFRDPTTLGRTGLKVSRLGIGSSYGVPADAIEKAYHEYGVNYFYWGSIRRAGMKEAIHHLRANRESLVIALQSYDRTGLLMPIFLEKGLKALGIEYADILILGWHNLFPSKRILDAALRLRDQGKVHFLAMSGHNRHLFSQMAERVNSPIDIFMIRYNAAHRGAEKEIFPYLPKENRPGVTAYTATSWRQLLNQQKMPPGEGPLTSAECYRFVLSNLYVDLCLTGPANKREMGETLRALDEGPLSEEEMVRIRRIGNHVRGQ